jgi:hypothetical protein
MSLKSNHPPEASAHYPTTITDHQYCRNRAAEYKLFVCTASSCTIVLFTQRTCLPFSNDSRIANWTMLAQATAYFYFHFSTRPIWRSYTSCRLPTFD